MKQYKLGIFGLHARTWTFSSDTERTNFINAYLAQCKDRIETWEVEDNKIIKRG